MSQRRSPINRLRLAALATPVVLAIPAYLQAQSVFTATPTGDWSVDANWNPNGAPNSTSTSVTIANGATAVISDGESFAAHNLNVGVSGTGTLSITSNGIYSGNAVDNFGNSGAGTLLLSGSFTNTQNTIFGNGSSGAGTLIMAGGTLTLTNTSVLNLILGQGNGSGTLIQNAGLISLPASGTFGLGRGGTGYYDMEGGTLIIGGILQMSTAAGGSGIGTLIQNAGTIMANLSSLGVNGLATCTMGGGTFITTTGLNLAGNAASVTTFTQNELEYVSAGSMDVGVGSSTGATVGVATYTLSSGTLSVGTNMIVGGSNATTGQGTFAQTSGFVSVGGNLTIGAGVNSTGLMSVTGNGSVQLSPTSTVSVGTTGSGTFDLCSTAIGTASLSAGTIQVGSVSTGTNEVDAQFLMGSTTLLDATPDVLPIDSPTVTVGTINFGLTNNSAATNRLFSIASGTLNAGLVDLTSYNEPGGTSPNQATFQQLGGTATIGSMTFAGGVYQVGNATAAPVVVNAASLFVNQAGTVQLASGATASYFGGGTIACVGSLTLPGALVNNGATLNVGAATNGTGTVSFRGAQTNAVGSGIKVYSGQANLQTDGGTNLTLTVANTAKAVIGGGTFINATENLGTVSILGGGVVRLFSTAAGSTPMVLLHTGTLSIHGDSVPTGTLDVAADDAIVDNGNFATIQAQVKSGYSGGTWNGPGIRSSVAAGKPTGLVGVGYASVSEIGTTTFDGVSGLSPSAVLLKYTVVGDANLDGTVNALDFNALATNYGQGGKDWAQGDFNDSADGTVDSNDFDLLAANFGGTVAALGADLPDGAAPAGSLGALVPEPMSLSLLTLSGLGLLQRRRRA